MSTGNTLNRIYLTISKQAGQAYIGQGPDSRIDEDHSKKYEKLVSQPDVIQWESEPFSSRKDADIAEAAAISIATQIGSTFELVNIQKASQKFAPRYPIPFSPGSVKKTDLPRAIVVTIAPDMLDNDPRPAPNSAWDPDEFADRARMFWTFDADRVESWMRGKGAPDFLVAVAKGSGRILAVFAIDNSAWKTEPNNRDGFVAVPLTNPEEANANGMQGQKYTGDRRGGARTYGDKVA